MVILIAILFAIPATHARTITLSTGEWPPYFDSSLDNHGLLAQIISEAYGNVGISVDYSFLPWSRALSMAHHGNYDGSAAWSCTPSRSDDFHFSQPILPLYYVFFVRKGSQFHWQEIDDIKGLTIGLTQDYAYGDQLTSAVDRGLVNTDMTASDESNFRKLRAGRIDLFPMDPLTGLQMIDQLFSEAEARQLTYHPRPIHQASYHLIFSRQQDNGGELARQFNQGLETLRVSGRLDEILDSQLGESPMWHALGPLLTTEPRQSRCGIGDARTAGHNSEPGR
ncbi:substrate-binding periplasmic protein [Marinobacter sp. M1N3S26]|uniref:substrate-binding periplasmic protein n=1 Tax=Marinobacter sp. M1N3S26 TaxID=3382299 RepID=UPI00387B5BD5